MHNDLWRIIAIVIVVLFVFFVYCGEWIKALFNFGGRGH